MSDRAINLVLLSPPRPGQVMTPEQWEEARRRNSPAPVARHRSATRQPKSTHP